MTEFHQEQLSFRSKSVLHGHGGSGGEVAAHAEVAELSATNSRLREEVEEQRRELSSMREVYQDCEQRMLQLQAQIRATGTSSAARPRLRAEHRRGLGPPSPPGTPPFPGASRLNPPRAAAAAVGGSRCEVGTQNANDSTACDMRDLARQRAKVAKIDQDLLRLEARSRPPRGLERGAGGSAATQAEFSASSAMGPDIASREVHVAGVAVNTLGAGTPQWVTKAGAAVLRGLPSSTG